MTHTATLPTRQYAIDPEDHLGLVFSIAVKLYRRLAMRVELDELVGYGTEGLIEACSRFDASRGATFSTFAYRRIQGAMLDGVRRLGPLPRAVYRRRRAVEVTDHIHVEEEPVAMAVATVAPDHGQRIDRADQLERLREALAELPEVQRDLMVRHYLEGLSLVDAGRELGISKSWASRQHARALAALREAMAA